MNWQPIETAPKDGRNVILLTEDGLIEGWWLHNCWMQSVCYATHEGCGDVLLYSQPTHWSDLPNYPSELYTG